MSGKTETTSSINHPAAAQFKMGETYCNAKDYVHALDWLLKAAAQDHAEACFYLGRIYEMGFGGIEKDFALAGFYYEKSAQGGCALGQASFGWMYEYGFFGVDKDIDKAIEWYQKADAQNNLEASYLLGVIFFKKDDFKSAFEYFVKAANKIEAQLYLAAMYELGGKGVEQNLELAQEWRQKAEKINKRKAQLFLGQMYFSGWCYPKDFQKAFKIYQELAENYQDSEAQCSLGKIYENGFGGIEKNLELARVYYEKSAKGRYWGGQICWGWLLEHGYWGVSKNLAIAVEYYQKAAKFNSAYSFFALGKIYYKGMEGIPRDLKKAFHNFYLAAYRGDAGTEALYYVARMYEEGIENWLKKDLVKAAAFYEKSAKRGDPDGQVAIGWLYEHGSGVKTDYKVAFGWYEKAANQNNANGNWCLGRMYEKGWGCKEDIFKAIACYEKAAELGNVEAKCALGKLYKKGHAYFSGSFFGSEPLILHKDLEPDLKKAIHWLQQAVDQDHTEAIYELAQIFYGSFHGKDGKEFCDKKKAFVLFQKLETKEHRDSYYFLGTFYEEGFGGVAQNYQHAVEYYEKDVSKKGDSDTISTFRLGIIYYKGLGSIPKNYKKAFSLLSQMDILRVACVYYLGTMYEFGLGTAQDIKKAIDCYNESYDPKAKLALERLQGIELYHPPQQPAITYSQHAGHFQQRLKKLTQLTENGEVEVHSLGLGKGFITKQMAKHILNLDENGSILIPAERNPELGINQVTILRNDKKHPVIFCKLAGAIKPATNVAFWHEYFSNNLLFNLGETDPAVTDVWLFKINTEAGIKYYFVQFSGALPGTRLDKFISFSAVPSNNQTAVFPALKKITIVNYTQLLAWTLLTVQKDHKMDQFNIVKVDKEKDCFRVLGFDNDMHGYVAAFKPFSSNLLNLKSFLLLLPEQLRASVDHNFKGAFLKQNPLGRVLIMLSDLCAWNRQADNAFADFLQLVDADISCNTIATQADYPIKLPASYANTILARVTAVYNGLVNAKTNEDVFKATEPAIYAYYQLAPQLWSVITWLKEYLLLPQKTAKSIKIYEYLQKKFSLQELTELLAYFNQFIDGYKSELNDYINAKDFDFQFFLLFKEKPELLEMFQKVIVLVPGVSQAYVDLQFEIDLTSVYWSYIQGDRWNIFDLFVRYQLKTLPESESHAYKFPGLEDQELSPKEILENFLTQFDFAVLTDPAQRTNFILTILVVYNKDIKLLTNHPLRCLCNVNFSSFIAKNFVELFVSLGQENKKLFIDFLLQIFQDSMEYLKFAPALYLLLGAFTIEKTPLQILVDNTDDQSKWGFSVLDLLADFDHPDKLELISLLIEQGYYYSNDPLKIIKLYESYRLQPNHYPDAAKDNKFVTGYLTEEEPELNANDLIKAGMRTLPLYLHPDKSGNRPITALEIAELYTKLGIITLEDKPETRIRWQQTLSQQNLPLITIKGAPFGQETRLLSVAVIKKLCANSQGDFLTGVLKGVRTSTRVQGESYDFFIKVNPENPKNELAYQDLHHRLVGQGCTYSALMNMSVVIDNKEIVQPVTFSKTILGHRLDKALKEQKNRSDDKTIKIDDRKTFFSQVKFELLMGVWDGDSRNYVISPYFNILNSRINYLITSIDNERLCNPAFIRNKVSYEAGIHSVLLVLDLMNSPFQPKNILDWQTFDILKVITAWSEGLAKFDATYVSGANNTPPIFSQNKLPESDLNAENFSKICFNLLDFNKLKEEFNEKDTFFKLIEFFSPKLTKIYRNASNEHEAIEVRYAAIKKNQVNGKSLSRSKSKPFWVSWNRVNTRSIFGDERYKSILKQLNDFESTCNNLVNKILSAQHDMSGFVESLAELKQHSEFVLKYVANQVVAKLKNTLAQNKFLMLLVEKKIAFRTLDLSNLSIQFGEYLENILKNSPELVSLKLSGCKLDGINVGKLLSTYAKSLKRLDVSETAIKSLGLKLENLSHIIIRGCVQLKVLEIRTKKRDLEVNATDQQQFDSSKKSEKDFYIFNINVSLTAPQATLLPRKINSFAFFPGRKDSANNLIDPKQGKISEGTNLRI